MPLMPVLSKRWNAPESWTIDSYQRAEGYAALRKALHSSPEDVVAAVTASNLRGRGGSGFPAGVKWGFLRNDGRPHYLVINADEGEPGTCRDAPLMMADPHAVIEGIIISSFAIRANHAFIYLRGEFVHARRRLAAAIREARAAGYLGPNILGSGYDLDIILHSGAGAYICGEESALLDSLEGYRGQPRLRPPFPAEKGLYASPTVVNNVGTIACVPPVILGGADWWKGIGPEGSPGTSIYSLSGRVVNPGQYEAPMGTTLRELLQLAGGVRAGHELKFWTPGGSSMPMWTAEQLDVPLDFDSTRAAGSQAGTAATMIFDDSDCVIRAAGRWSQFYAHESCGKCTPCREGTFWFVQIYERLERGDATAADIDTLLDVSENMFGKSFCALGDGAVSPVISSIKYFRDEYIAHFDSRGCPFRRELVTAA
ncbi:MAG TPA: NADH-quinone oxidoreductase subunit NuoF [Mycobacteriales bacterium]|nr:NADH-quinone oxidoreductase subunit NuoF [Mycobacteriales bacterium]